MLTEVYACPVGRVVILKAHALHEDGPAFAQTYVYIKTGGNEYTYRELDSGGTARTDYMKIELVLEDGDQIGLLVGDGSYTGRLRYYFSGAVLTSP